MLDSKDLTIVQGGCETSRACSIKNPVHITWYLSRNFQLDRSSGFRNVRKSDIVGEIPEIFNVSVHSLSDFCFGGHLVDS